jgi:signal transduction histidine kinase/ActR/RegA family two-component response regulator
MMRKSLSKKLLIGVVLSSTLVTIFVTVIQLYQDYLDQIHINKEQFNTILHISRKSLETSVWDLNNEQITNTLKGYLDHNDVDYLELYYENISGTVIETHGDKPKDYLTKKYQLYYEGNPIGWIHLYSDKNKIVNYIWRNFAKILFINFLKTFVATFFILFVINQLVVRHLLQITNYLTHEWGKSDSVLKLNRIGGEGFHENDELDVLTKKINEMITTVRDQKKNLETQVEERTQDLLLAKDRAEKATKAQAQFLATMSHEIRTPLNGILGNAHLLKDLVQGDEKKEMVETIHTSGDMLLVIINDILDYSKMESGKLDLQLRDFQISEVIDDSLSMIRNRADDNKVTLVTEKNEVAHDFATGDQIRLKQILLNLLSNAVKFTEGGTVTLKYGVEELDDKLKLSFSVQDTGIGIAEHALDKLFSRFYQVESNSTRTYDGTGLGLAICKQLVTLMGGEIKVDSKFGIGTTFSFFVYMNKADAKSVAEQTGVFFLNKEEKEVEVSKLKVLLAEDNKINQKVAVKMLQKLGISCDIANDGLEAVAASEEKDYDIILMDYHMPNMDGLDATKIIRSSGNMKTMIVALTANALSEHEKACSEAGMNLFISKPISPVAIKKIIAEYLNHKNVA